MSFIESARRAGLEVFDRERFRVRCVACGQTWSPNSRSGGKLYRGWRRCPNGCNDELVANGRPVSR